MMKNIEKLAELKKSKRHFSGEAEMVRMSDLPMKKINWLWPNRIARGKLTVIAGNPGLGKSQITASLAATITTGGKWPDTDNFAIKGSVIILSAEDDPADTIKPRLVAAGADVSRCHVLKAIKVKKNGKTSIRTVDLSQDVDRLGAEIEKIKDVALVIIDPISAYMGKIDSNNNSEVRGLLAPLKEMTEKSKVAVLLVTHLNKSSTQEPIGRVIGSIGMIAAARAGYAVIKDEKDPAIRYFVPIKNNIGNDRDGFSFHIEPMTLQEDIETSRILWHDSLVNAHKVLYPEPEKKPTATTEAGAFLLDRLANGAMLKADIEEEAEGAGYSKSALQRAKQRLGIKHRKRGFNGGFEWHLPTNTPEGVEHAEDAEEISVSSMMPSTKVANTSEDATPK